MKEVIDIASEVTKSRIPYNISLRRPGDPDKLVADPTKAEAILSWKASKTTKDAIQDAYNFINN